MLKRRVTRGFTIIELMVTIAIVAIILMLGVPSFSSLLQNHKLTSAAKSFTEGLQVARTEAIRRNTSVEFVLSSAPLTGVADNDAAGAVQSVTGPNWVVRVPSGTGPVTYAAVEAKAAQDSSAGTATSVTVVGAVASGAPVSTTFAGTIAFNGLGVPLDNSGSLNTAGAYVLRVENPGGGTCAAAGGQMRCMQIRVRPGGQIQLCDPAVTDARDSRSC